MSRENRSSTGCVGFCPAVEVRDPIVPHHHEARHALALQAKIRGRGSGWRFRRGEG